MLTESSHEKALTLDPHRTQILQDMGIEVWRQRRLAPKRAPTGNPAGASAPVAAQGRSAGALQEGRQPRRRPPSAPMDAARRPAKAGARPERSSPAAATPTDAAFTLLATCTKGTLVATGAFTSRKQAALAGDIARCACRNWTADLKHLRFDWPLPGVGGSAAPALGAFLERQMQDFAVRRLLVTASMANKVPSGAIDHITIPDLEQLDDPDAKRELWRRLQGQS